MLKSYRFYKNGTEMFEVIASVEEGYALQLQRMYYDGNYQFVVTSEAGDVAVVQGPLECSNTVGVPSYAGEE